MSERFAVVRIEIERLAIVGGRLLMIARRLADDTEEMPPFRRRAVITQIALAEAGRFGEVAPVCQAADLVDPWPPPAVTGRVTIASA